MDPTAHIQEDKALTADIRPGQRPRGHRRPEFVAAQRNRAGVDQRTGTGI
jgi:formate dehydrogenase major subunit